MRRLSIALLLLCAACGRESREDAAHTDTLPVNPPVVRTATRAPSTTAAVAPSALGRSTPSKCVGDGSYEQALDCFRISSGFHFVLNGNEGEMTRKTPGMERVQFKAADGVTWIGEAKPSGVVWTRNGSHQAAPPNLTNQIWQRTTMVLDPQKKEGTVQVAGTETIGGEASRHYHFTNANSGEANDVWVSTKDGRIVRWSAGKSTLELR